MVSDKVLPSNGSQRIFTIGLNVLSESHLKIYLDGVAISADDYDLINNAAVFHTAPAEGTLTLQVGTTPDDLLLTPTDAGIVAANMDNVVLAAQSVATIQTVADNILDVNTNATNIVAIQNASANADTAIAKAQEASNSASTALELKNTVVEKEALVNPHYGAIDSIAAVEVLEDMNILANTQTLADIEAVAGIADLIEEGVGSIGNTTSQGMFQHNKRIVSDKTITEDYNAISAGPVTVDEGVTVTVPEGSTWVIC